MNREGGAHGDLVLPHEEELVRDVLISASLGCHSQETVVSQAPKGRDSGQQQSTELGLQRRRL